MELDKGGYVLLGVVLTLVVGVLKDVIAGWLKNRREKGYLSVQIIFLLDDFALKCAAVVGDDGTYMGQYGKDGYARTQVETPVLNFSDLKGDWKSIKPELLYKLHDLASSIISAESKVSFDFENANPPEFSEGYESRQHQYAVLGVQSFEIANEFRRINKMPPRIWLHFDPIAYMREDLQRQSELDEVRRVAHEKWMRLNKEKSLQ